MELMLWVFNCSIWIQVSAVSRSYERSEIPDQGMAESGEGTGQDVSLDSVHVDVLVRAHKKVTNNPFAFQ